MASVDVLFRLRQPQREVAIRIAGRLSDERASALHRFGSLARLDEGENQVVDGLPKVRALGHRPAVRVDGGVERAHALERFAEPVLHVGITRREPGRLPQQREGAREIPARLQLDRPRVRVLRARRRLLRTRGRVRWKKKEGDDRQPHAVSLSQVGGPRLASHHGERASLPYARAERARPHCARAAAADLHASRRELCRIDAAESLSRRCVHVVETVCQPLCSRGARGRGERRRASGRGDGPPGARREVPRRLSANG